MVDYKYKDLFTKSHVDKQLRIATDDGMFVVTNEDIHFEDFELTESLCSDSELRFGSCEASMVKFQIRNAFIPLAGKWITIAETLDGNADAPFQYGKYKVFSDVPTADREYRDIVAYDAMYDIINSSAISWYNSILPHKDSKVTMKQFRESFVRYFGLSEVVPDTGIMDPNDSHINGLANDDIIVEKTIQVEEDINIDNNTEQTSILKESSLSGLNVIQAICEINGCFGHIGRDGKFHYIYLTQDIMGLYPSNTLFPDRAPYYLPQADTGHLYPQSPKSTRIGNGTYIEANYEGFICRKINKVQIRQKENDIGGQYPKEKVADKNAYIIEDNFLVYGKSAEELEVIAKNIYEKVKNIVYRPFKAECVGNPCLEVGDPVRIPTRYEIIESYILKRTLKGIQSLRDSYSSEGLERRSEKVNSVSKSIIQLKGKTNILERNVEETRSEIKDVESGLSSRIEQTVKSVSMSVSNDRTGKTAEVKLLVTDEGGTQYEVKADKIDLTGLVSFTNLETGGQTIINGNNIITGKINCSLLNGGEINGQKIVGGEITGATIKAKEGLYLQYTNNNTRPPISGEYVFAKTGYGYEGNLGGISNDSFLVINTPEGTPAMVTGTMDVSDHSTVSKPPELGTGAFFPGLSYLNRARINDLQMTFYWENSFTAENLEEGDVKNVHEAYLTIRVFGVFICICGKYNFREHKAKEYIDIDVSFDGLEEKYIPEWANVPVCTSHSGIPFVFILRTDKILRIINAGEKDVVKTGEGHVTIGFRFDFLKT